MKDEMQIGKLLKFYRQKYDISLRKLAEDIGISESTLSRIENGKFLPDLRTFQKIFNWMLGK